MFATIWHLVPLLASVVFAAAALATVALLVRAEYTPGVDGRRRPQPARSKFQAWPDPARIPRAGRRYERQARRTLLLALAALGLALLALRTQ